MVVVTGSTGLINTPCQGVLTYLAATLPSSIRHRHTTRGCLWRTSHRETGKTTVRRLRATHERRDASRDKLRNTSCIAESMQTGFYLCAVFILGGKVGIPGGAAKGIRASDTYHLMPPTTLRRKLFLNNCSF